MRVPITRPMLGPEENAALQSVLESGWLVQGPRVAEFERAVAEWCGASFCVATANCTTALHLGLAALGVGPGDEVLVPSFTYVATANAVCYTGARPVLADIDLRTFNLRLEELERLSTARTRAVIPVSLFGACANLPAVSAWARERGVAVLEDAACALGARLGGRHAGTWPDAGCFSFHPRKNVTTGEGGMLVTDDPEIAACVRSLRDHGAAVSDRTRHESGRGSLLPAFDRLGYNYRLTDLQGALGCVQMGRLPEILRLRTAWARRYLAELPGRCPSLRPPSVPEGSIHAWQSFVCLYTGGNRVFDEQGRLAVSLERVEALHKQRNRMMAVLAERGIATRQGTHAVHGLSYYRRTLGHRCSDLPAAWAADRLTVSLPLYAQMTEEDLAYVLDGLSRCAP